ncbi:MAG: TylF/MycF/NovP-related O-methyltransferase [Desulfovibrionaceae bacterium]
MHSPKTTAPAALPQGVLACNLALIAGDTEQVAREYWKLKWSEARQAQPDDYPVFDFDYTQREHFYRFVNAQLLRKQPVDYLEFGVARGESFRAWMRLNADPTSRFFGFDSFEGLPEDWLPKIKKGAYSARGHAPDIDDQRGVFLKGLFQETLPEFAAGFEPKNRLVLHMDADLYSSTLYALTMLDRFIRPGTIILFDEFLSAGGGHEFAALHDWARSYYREWKIVAARRDHQKLAVEIG